MSLLEIDRLTLDIHKTPILRDVSLAIAPGEVSGLLGEVANNIDADLLVARRLYAVEFVLAFAGLALYLAVTEIAPRLQRARSNP